MYNPNDSQYWAKMAEGRIQKFRDEAERDALLAQFRRPGQFSLVRLAVIIIAMSVAFLMLTQ